MQWRAEILRWGAFAFGLFAATAASAASIDSCAALGTLHSGDGTGVAPLTLQNDGRDVSLNWLDFSGQAVPFGAAAKGQALSIDSYASHAWSLERGGKCICTFVLDGGAQTVSVDADGQCAAGPLAIDVAYETTGEYARSTVNGWTVLASSHYSKKKLAPVMKMLTRDLGKLRQDLPAEVVRKLGSVQIWLEVADEMFPGGVYHHGTGWLIPNGYNPDKADGVQLTANLVPWSEVQPSMVLHEFAHAYEAQVLGYANPDLLAAYERAKASGRYASVDYALGGKEPAYAMNNEMEFFAELTEAYFGRNDYYPFTRKELKKFDPQSYAMIEKLWGVSGSP